MWKLLNCRRGRTQANKESENAGRSLPFTDIIFSGKEFKVSAEIGRGAFGHVLLMKADDGEEIAVKVVAPSILWRQELDIWPNLKHRNILPLLKADTMNSHFIFIMPAYPCTLQQMVKKDFFRKDPTSFDVIREWLHHITSGLKYLHGMDLCHLDLKKDNVMISTRFRAVICDFGSLNTTREPIRRLPLHPYHPPEVWDFGSNEISSVFGGPVDIWDFGILAMGCFNTVKTWPRALKKQDWKGGKYPTVYNHLKLPVFKESLKANLPTAIVSEADCIQALNFVRGLLRFDPGDRPVADQILQHSLLPGSSCSRLFEADGFWKDEKDVETKIRKFVKKKMKAKDKSSSKSLVRRWCGGLTKQALKIQKCFCCC